MLVCKEIKFLIILHMRGFSVYFMGIPKEVYRCCRGISAINASNYNILQIPFEHIFGT